MLQNPQSLLCIFPQGSLLPWNTRPLGFKSGILSILDRCPTNFDLVHLSIKIEYLNAQLPQVFFLLQKNPQCALPVEQLEKFAENGLATLESHIMAGERGETVLKGKESIDVRFQRLRGIRPQ
jgi:hypothetical protein